jgi:hypothetical protein
MTTLDPKRSWGEMVLHWHRQGSSAKRISRKTGIRLEKIEAWIKEYDQKFPLHDSEKSEG